MPNSDGAMSPTQGGRGWTPTRRSHTPIRRLCWERRTSSCSLTSAYMLGRDDDYLSGLERAHHAYLAIGEAVRAVRCAFWVASISHSEERWPARPDGSVARNG